MSTPASRPLLFLDVDGVLIPFGGSGRRPVYQPIPLSEDGVSPLLARIDPGHGRLKALGCELAWATTWADDANQYIAPRLGLQRLAVVTWPESSAAEEEQDERLGLHWKLGSLSAGPLDAHSPGPTDWLRKKVQAEGKIFEEELGLIHLADDPAEVIWIIKKAHVESGFDGTTAVEGGV